MKLPVDLSLIIETESILPPKDSIERCNCDILNKKI